MRALEPEVFDAVWGAVRALLPAASRFHPWAVTVPGSVTRCAFGVS